jgi:RNA polymerase sigma factor (sigma-70 family)
MAESLVIESERIMKPHSFTKGSAMDDRTPKPFPEMIQHWRRLLGLREMLQEPDAVLLKCFCVDRNETAFAALMSRHGPMVKGVCRRILRSDEDVDDVVQATFLALAKHAHAFRADSVVAAWLHRTARNLAINLYHRIRRRQENSNSRSPTDPPTEASWRETLQVLDEEMQQLPEKYRSVLILCYLEGMSQDEAARQLGCTRAAVRFRVERGRELLGARLRRRGVVVGTALLLLGSQTAAEAASFAVRAGCLKATVQAALQVAQGQAAVGVAARVLSLSGRVGSATFPLNKLGIGILAVLLTAVAGLAAAWTYTPRAPVPEAAANARGEETTQTVSGRVLDTDGKPAPKAAVAVLAGQEVLAQGHADEKGRFQLDIPTSAQLERRGGRWVVIVARTDKHGVNWRSFPLDAALTHCSLRLPREQTVRCRVMLGGRPAVGAQVRLVGMAEPASLQNELLFRCPENRLDEPTRLDLWPRSVTVDAEGYATLTGLDGDRDTVLAVRQAGRAEQTFSLASLRAKADQATREKEQINEVKLDLAPASRQVSGRIVRDDTGKSIPATVMLVDQFTSTYTHRPIATTQADQEGRFHFDGVVNGNALAIVAPTGEPYLPEWITLDARGGELRITLKRGVLLRGRVVDDRKQPVPSAEVRFVAVPFQPITFRLLRIAAVSTDNEGRFVLPVVPGSGHLLVHATRGAYVPSETVSLGSTLQNVQSPWTVRTSAHALRQMTIPPEGQKEVSITLKRGEQPRVAFVQPDGTEGGDAYVFSWLHPDAGDIGAFKADWATGGQYPLSGCDPDFIYPTVIWDARANRGAVVDVPGKPDPKSPKQMKLAACGSALIRLVDAAGRPVAGGAVQVSLVIEPPYRAEGTAGGRPTKPGRECGSAVFPTLLRSDAQGQVRLSSLVPGARYRMAYVIPGIPNPLKDRVFRASPGEDVRQRDFVVPAGAPAAK